MGGNGRVATLVVPIFVMVVLVVSVEATTYQVGDKSGWTKPTDPSFYSTWASKNTFHVNDILVFDFAAGSHDVAQVNEEAYTNCDASSPTINSSPPISVTLTASSYFFICTVGGGSHCQAGQKLAVTVSTNSSATTPASPSTTPPPSPPSSPPPPPSSPPPPSNSPPPPPSSASSPVTAAASLVFGLVVYVAGFLN